MGLTTKEIDSYIEDSPEFQDLAEHNPSEFRAQVHEMYRRHGYDANGNELPLAQQGMIKASHFTGIPEGAIRTAAGMVLPTLGTTAGMAMGAFAGPEAILPGAMVGSYGGQKLNEALGITPPGTMGEDLLSFGAPLIGPAAKLAKDSAIGVAKHLPGAQVGMHELAKETVEQAISKMRVTKDMVTNAAKTFTKSVPRVDVELPRFKQLLNEEAHTIGQSIEMEGQQGKLDRINDFFETLKKSGGKVSAEKLFAWQHTANELKDTGWTFYKRMSGTLISDLEEQVANPKLSAGKRAQLADVLEKYRGFVQISKQYRGDEQLDGILNRAINRAQGDNTLFQFNKRQFIKDLTKAGSDIREVFPAKDIDAMKDAVEDLGYIASQPAHQLMQKYSLTGAALSAGALASGVGPSKLLPLAVIGASGLYSLLKTQAGRTIIKQMTKLGQGKLNLPEALATYEQMTKASMPQIGASIGAAYRAQTPPDLSAFEQPRAFPNEQ